MRTFEEMFDKYKKEFLEAYPLSKELEHHNTEALFYTVMVYLIREIMSSKYANEELLKEFQAGLPEQFMK